MIGSLLRLAAPALISSGVLRGFSAALNHLLRQHPNAASRLAAHSGSRIRLGLDRAALPASIVAPELWLEVTGTGHLRIVTGGPADVEMLLKPSLAAGQALAREGVRGLSTHMRVEGDVMLAGLVGEILDELAWDYEDDLGRLLGDGAAARMGRVLRSGRESARDFGARARDQMRGVAEEAGARGAFAAVTRPVHDALRDQIERLADRVAGLEERVTGRSRDGRPRAAGDAGEPGEKSARAAPDRDG